STRGELVADPRTNSLIVRDIPEYLDRIKVFIARFDRPTPGVLIESRIVEISRSDARALGIIWGGAWTPGAGQNPPIVEVRGSAPARGGGDKTTGSGQPTTAATFPIGLPSATVFNPAALFGLTLGWLASNFALDVQLQALEGEARAKVVS